MKEILTCSRMAALDKHTIEQMGVPSCVLMERAALAVTEELKKHFDRSRASREKVLVVCGSGNNGGDGIAIARLLHLAGIPVELYLLGKEENMTVETARQLRIARNYSVPEVNNPAIHEYTTIVDAIFGVGLSRPVEGRYGRVIDELNAADAFRVAVDIPSGISGDTGEIMGTAFRADLTVTFGFRKRGHCFYPGRAFSGEVHVADIGVYTAPTGEPSAFHLEMDDLALLPELLPWSHKGTAGKILFVAGSPGMCGAAYLSAGAALRCGAGMVKIQTPEENRIPLATLLPEAMLSCAFNEEENRRNLDWCDVLVIGPGLGASDEGRERAEWFLSHGKKAGKPMVLDADGLNLLAGNPGWKEYLGADTVLTPHMGEMSRLLGSGIPEIKASPVKAAAEYAKETGAVCVLKDACTVVADGESVYLNLSGNAGMATAGSGDVLSGILGAVLCMCRKQKNGFSTGLQAALGVYIHGLAGDRAAAAAGKRAMTAKDIIRFIPEI